MKRRDFLTSVLLSSGALFLSKKGFALEFYPNPSEKKWAILYGSRYGSTRDASVWISEGMGGIANVFDARENPDLDRYEHLIVGSGVYGGNFADPFESFLKATVKSIHKKIKGIFVVCGAGEQGATRYIPKLAELCQAQSPISKSFPGRITKRLLEPEVTEQLKEYYERSQRPFEDYDNLSRSDCLDFGKEILDKYI